MIDRDKIRKHLIKDDKPTFGEFLKRLRMDAGLSLRQLAQNAGLSHPYVYDLERDRRHPSEVAIIKLAQAIPPISTDETEASVEWEVRLEVFYRLAGILGVWAEKYLERTPDAMQVVRLMANHYLTNEQIAQVRQFIESIAHEEDGE